MNPERWGRIKRICDTALELEPGRRGGFVREACGEDESLRREVESLLARESQAGGFLELPALEEAARALAQDQNGATDTDLTGRTLLQYRITAKIGAGGMGVVYEATDTKLGRSVALKVIREELSREGERMARFRREARLLASLNHANIAAIHDLEESDGICFLVMEYVPGKTLQERLERGPLPVREAIALAAQIAEALEAAHEKGIIHRDLKPGNIKVTEEGKVKVLDFGLAKALEAAPASDLSLSLAEGSGTTRKGMVLGTAPYMSPEQACGRPLDTRTDIWSFGCVLYEMLTGKRAFAGETITEVLAGIVERAPEWGLLPEGVSENVQCLLRRCLEKNPHCRLRAIGDARIELEDTLAGRVPVASVVQSAGRRNVVAAALAGVLLGLSAVGLWVWLQAAAEVPPRVVRFSFNVPEGKGIRTSWYPTLMFSPDGGTLGAALQNLQVVARSSAIGAWSTFLRRLDELEGKSLENAPGMGVPVFSPDGSHLIVWDVPHQVLKKVALSGGAPVLFATADIAIRGDWASDNYYYWTDGYFGPIVRTPDSGGKSEPVTTLDLEKQERTHRHAQMLPGGKAIIFTVSQGGVDSFDDARIDAFTLQTRKRQTLIQGGFGARYSASGHIVYARGGSLYAVPFDAGGLEVTGSPVKVVDGVLMSTNSGSAYFDISRKGALAYAAGQAVGGERTLLWVDRQGRETPLGFPPRSYVFPRISPDGKQLAYEIEGMNHDLYTYDPDRDITTKITTDGVSHAPVWTPDGKRIAFRSWKAGVMSMWWMPADRSGPEERLTSIGQRQSVVSFSPDMRYVAYNQMDVAGGASDVWMLPLHGDRKPRPFVKSRFNEASARFSPDGKWVAYCTNESRQNEVFVQPWPGPGPKIKVSSEGGTDPIWRRDGKELFYRNGDKMMAVAVSTAPTFRASKPQVLWEGHYSHGMGSSCGPPGTTEASYDVSADGQRFLMVRDLDQDSISTQIVVVVNFAEELKRLVQARK
ncbi:MAG: serine/threonine-protein kinase [Acidobacteria bacterium]|nr:MAG: serine/threonine-protein kinase [Acidobacteriota bacterium]